MRPDLTFLDGHRLTVYSSHGCPDCTRLKHWMKLTGVNAEEVLIDEDPDAADKLENETGKQAVPFILIDERTWVRGYHLELRARFDETVLVDELKRAIATSGPASASRE
jgi:glutaredoxin